MKTKRFSEAQILAVLKEYETGVSAADLSRKYGIGESTVYAWHSKYAGMDHELLKEALGKKLNRDLSDEKWREI